MSIFEQFHSIVNPSTTLGAFLISIAASIVASGLIGFFTGRQYRKMIEKKNSIPVAFLGLKQAKENYELSYGRYKVGVGNPIELKEAQVQYQNAMLQYYNSLNLYNASRADLEQYIGRNLNEGEVQLQVDTTQKKKKSK